MSATIFFSLSTKGMHTVQYTQYQMLLRTYRRIKTGFQFGIRYFPIWWWRQMFMAFVFSTFIRIPFVCVCVSLFIAIISKLKHNGIHIHTFSTFIYSSDVPTKDTETHFLHCNIILYYIIFSWRPSPFIHTYGRFTECNVCVYMCICPR